MTFSMSMSKILSTENVLHDTPQLRSGTTKQSSSLHVLASILGEGLIFTNRMAQMKANSKTLLTQLVQDAVLKLCTQHITFDTQLEIDGIICVSPGEMVPEIVIKMHRTIMKPEEPVQAQWADITGSDVYTGSPQATHTQSQRSRNRSSQIRGSPQQPSPRHDPPHSKRRLDNQPQLEQYAIPDSMPQTSINIKPEPPYLDSQTLSGSVGSGDSNTGYGFEPESSYGVPSGSAKKRKPPELDTTSVANKIIKTEEPILIEEDMTTPTDQTYMGEDNGAIVQQDKSNQQYIRAEVSQTEADIFQTGSDIVVTGARLLHHKQKTFIDVVEKHQCNVCEELFPSNRCVEHHTMLVHNKYCSICNSRVDELTEQECKAHGREHIGEKPNHCVHCYKLFTGKPGVAMHLARDLQCLICGMRILRNNKKAHLELHSQH
ncbi:unnamed protein product [Owenia fusiformis]|uniref:C2H2-type domain-containing protein n=1 Tax=Owenia fusiformis TaxID=6347 RepID=A0A8S4N7T1_OWEFU|nr:unnamed protein product [Owenia fusiformis]